MSQIKNSIINWDNFFKQKEFYDNATPFHFAFVENVFEESFYEKLYDTYPSFDNTWIDYSNFSKTQLIKQWNNISDPKQFSSGPDPTVSDSWNKFKLYAESEEFLSNMRKFTGTKVNKLKLFQFMSYKQGGYQLPHIHNVGPNTLVMMWYFSKNWKDGEPGGTYMASEPDESKIIFEPYNLNNSVAFFHDSPTAAHGVRMISKDVERRGVQIYLEEYDEETGWTGVDPNSKTFKENLPEI